MSWLCHFRRCRWNHIGNFTGIDPLVVGYFGLWQCRTCKTVSIGTTLT